MTAKKTPAKAPVQLVQESSEVVKAPVPMSSELITSIADLNKYANGMIVDLPAFGPDMPLRVRIKRPSILALAKEGSIPNSLLNSAAELFVTGRVGNKPETKDSALRDMYAVCEIMATAALMEPTYAEIKKAGVQLTDQQLMAIYSFTQEGVSALNSFRQE